MTWEEVESAARRAARNLEWNSPDAEPPGRLERAVRKVFRMPTTRRVDDAVSSRLVMVVPTSGTRDSRGVVKTYGWAVRLVGNGQLEYLRWQAFGQPNWSTPFAFAEHELEPLTPGADHWAPLDAGQRLKTDLDWSPERLVKTDAADGTSSWVIPPTRSPVARTTGAGLLDALRRVSGSDASTRVIDLRERDRALTR